jgi:hypothetical protein
VTPVLSYVIPCGGWRHVERVVDCLLAQDEVGGMELVLAGPAAVEHEVPEHVRQRFAAVTVVNADPAEMHDARARGLLAASAPRDALLSPARLGARDARGRRRVGRRRAADRERQSEDGLELGEPDDRLRPVPAARPR